MAYEFTDQYKRNDSNFYVEPRWCIESVLKNGQFQGAIHDPACGSGKIPTVARDFGYAATGADIIDRGFSGVILQNFLKDTNSYNNIVTNPPYKLSEEFIKHALLHTSDRIAILSRIAFLCGQKRHLLFKKYPPERIVILSRRPSMPPGGMNIYPQGGKTDFCWIIWKVGYDKMTETVWSL